MNCIEYKKLDGLDGFCSLTWQNSFYFFGGVSKPQYTSWMNDGEYRQISQLKGTILKKIGKLSFDLYLATCDVLADKIFLCFNEFFGNKPEEEYSRCRIILSPVSKSSTISQTNYDHLGAIIAASEGEFNSSIVNYCKLQFCTVRCYY